eukprot:3828253-Rhodomonas_salina.1
MLKTRQPTRAPPFAHQEARGSPRGKSLLTKRQEAKGAGDASRSRKTRKKTKERTHTHTQKKKPKKNPGQVKKGPGSSGP